MLAPAIIAAAYRAACHAELDAPKPGNVHRFAGGHGMDVAAFERSAEVTAPEIAAAGRSVGARVLASVEASFAAVGLNTNLGILLLSAPLAAAAETRPSGPHEKTGLRDGVRSILGALGPSDATDVFRAIARASPGGLGDGGANDVRQAPTISLVDAMRIAAPRDLVARQYAAGFDAVFSIGLPALRAARAEDRDPVWPATACFLAFATTFPDSHVARKFGADAAEQLRRRMEELAKHLQAMDNFEDRLTALLALDAALKREGLNPGTSADLTVATIFAGSLEDALKNTGAND